MILLTLLLLLAAALLTLIIRHRIHWQKMLIGHVVLYGGLAAALFATFHARGPGAVRMITVGRFEAPFGILFGVGELELALSVLFLVIAALVLWFAYFTLDFELPEGRRHSYLAIVDLLLLSLIGIVTTRDLFNAYVFLELSTLAACGLIVLKDKKENLKATMKYLVLSILGSGLVLIGIAYLFAMTGHLSFGEIHAALHNGGGEFDRMVKVAIVAFSFGLGVKAALFPVHIWLPDAHFSAPSPSSALLSSIVIKAPVVLLIKLFYQVFSLDLLVEARIFTILMILGSSGMLIGSLFAILQKNLKRMVAYSSVAQMGYIFLAIGLGTDFGLRVAFYHVFAHALTKSMLFLSVGSIYEQEKTLEIAELKGLGAELPVTLGVFALGALSMVGIPVLPGFITKWYLSLATIESGKLIYLFVILASSLLNAVYYFPIIINGFFGKENMKGRTQSKEAKPVIELLPVIILAVFLLLAGVYSGRIFEIFAV